MTVLRASLAFVAGFTMAALIGALSPGTLDQVVNAVRTGRGFPQAIPAIVAMAEASNALHKS